MTVITLAFLVGIAGLMSLLGLLVLGLDHHRDLPKKFRKGF